MELKGVWTDPFISITHSSDRLYLECSNLYIKYNYKKLFLFDIYTWNCIIVCKLFVLRIDTWINNHFIRIIAIS